MDQVITKIFEDTLNGDLIHIIISNSTDRENISKIKIRPVLVRQQLHYQVSQYRGNQIFHNNYLHEELIGKLPCWFEGLFRQAEIETNKGKVILLIGKKGNVTVNSKLNKKVSAGKQDNKDYEEKDISFLHNKKKNYILEEHVPLPFLIDLGVMTQDGTVVKTKSDKFRQINRFLEYIEDVLPYLEKGRELTILDFGCGKSYLTFAMYYYLKILKGYQINIIGLDLKADVIDRCNELSEKYGYDKLHFLVGDIASYQGSSSVDMVVTLHACDTATDYALYKAVSWGAQVILSVPCCQHELNRQIQCQTLKPVLKYGIIKERMAALFTDGLRAELLAMKGYRVQLLEFIDMEHTPKNILIRAVKCDKADHSSGIKEDELMKCMDFLGADPCLLKLFSEEEQKKDMK